MTEGRWRLPLALGCFVLGILIVVQFKTQQQEGFPLSSYRSQDLVRMVRDLERERNDLAKNLQELRNRMSEYEEAALQEKSLSRVLKEQLTDIKMIAGLLPVKGPGLEVTLKDSTKRPKPGEDVYFYIIHDVELQQLVTELWAAGAEAVSINDQRLIANTAVRCVGPTVLINTVRLSPPYVVRAIGDPDALESALKMNGGFLDAMAPALLHGVQISMEKRKEITLPPYSGSLNFTYLKPVTPPKKKVEDPERQRRVEDPGREKPR